MITLLVHLHATFLPVKFVEDNVEINNELLPELIAMAELAHLNNVPVRAELKGISGIVEWIFTVNPDYTGNVRHWVGVTLHFQLIQMATTHHLEVIPS